MMLAQQADSLHPAVEWAQQAGFAPQQVDCTTAVVLKILDNKCKMLPGEKAAVFAIYDTVKHLPAILFDEPVHTIIATARCQADADTQLDIHTTRVAAEAQIPKPVMKNYKAFLRDGLFG
jgi:hypothetical protein